MKLIKKLWDNYKHGIWLVVYMAFYLLGFFILEHAGHRHYHVIHSVLDDMIPFNEYFVVPYFLWFPYIMFGCLWFVFFGKHKSEYYKLVSTLSIGMTVFLIVSAIFPNCQDLRPTQFLHHNVFTGMVERLYAADTPTNILPSIHVYNSLVLFYALNSCRQLRKWVVVRTLMGVLTALIIMSTMTLKQHSVVDVSMGILMSFAVQMLCDRVFDGQRSTDAVRQV